MEIREKEGKTQLIDCVSDKVTYRDAICIKDILALDSRTILM
jgi:hypothetical protein